MLLFEERMFWEIWLGSGVNNGTESIAQRSGVPVCTQDSSKRSGTGGYENRMGDR